MTSDPADVRRAPEDVVVMVVKDVLECCGSVHHVPRLRVKYAFRLPRRTTAQHMITLNFTTSWQPLLNVKNSPKDDAYMYKYG